MSWREWWDAKVSPWVDALKDLFTEASEPTKDEDGKYLPPVTKDRKHVPPHASQPDGKPQPEWPSKKERE